MNSRDIRKEFGLLGRYWVESKRICDESDVKRSLGIVSGALQTCGIGTDKVVVLFIEKGTY